MIRISKEKMFSLHSNVHCTVKSSQNKNVNFTWLEILH